jgi:competence ComEA-like helix-hairpin-helix protein
MRNQQHLFHFSRRERNGIITLIFISILARAIPYFLETTLPGNIVHDDSLEWAKLKVITDTPGYYQTFAKEETNAAATTSSLFYFDPNTLDEPGWVKLGLSTKAAASIRKYISKGGRFYKPADIRKIYGLRPELADKLEPYVQIAARQQAKFVPFEKKEFNYKQRTVDINHGDSATFESLPGIGPTLAKRIITFREKLGGFYSIEQVGEVYGLPDSTFQKIKSSLKIAPFEIKKININTADKGILQAHPYIRYKLASLIVAYRQQHGNFKQVQEVKNIIGINENVYEKTKNYLTIE